MEKIVDSTKSKRPIMVETENDYAALTVKADRHEKIMDLIEEMIDAKESSSDYKRVVKDSADRLISLALQAMQIDPQKSEAMFIFSKIKGQYEERLLITQELSGLKLSLEKETSLVRQLRDKANRWLEKIMKKG